MCIPATITEHCLNCAHASEKLETPDGHCKPCITNRRPGDYFPGWERKEHSDGRD